MRRRFRDWLAALAIFGIVWLFLIVSLGLGR